jgi:hypothetical protein
MRHVRSERALALGATLPAIAPCGRLDGPTPGVGRDVA